tara:strand:+ start:538 stop:1047 length:510 start_codon:yes stop_codon:yes gene_type:complete
MSSATKSTTMSSATKVYEMKLGIYAHLIMNEFGSIDELEILVSGESPKNRSIFKLNSFKVELRSEVWGNKNIKMRFDMGTKWEYVKVGIESAMRRVTEIYKGEAERCPVCYEDLTDAKKIGACSVCKTTLCGCCLDKLCNGGVEHKCPICRTHLHRSADDAFFKKLNDT